MNHSEQAGLATRRLVLKALAAVLIDGKPVDEFLETDAGVRNLDARDRALLVAITQTVFRHKTVLERDIAIFLTKPLPRKAGVAPLILLSAAAQLRLLKMPAHAVIDTAVTLAKEDQHAKHFAGLINAVLRKVSTYVAATEKSQFAPDWLFGRWVRDYGQELARAIDAASAVESALDISVKHDALSWAQRLGGILLPTGTVRVENATGAVTLLDGFEAGDWWVQDAASAVPVLLFGDVNGKTCLDLCAAPGGKTMQFAARGAVVTALDLSVQRLARLKDNLTRTGLTATCIKADASRPFTDQLFDCVLLDAPCSATGTLRRHPDLAYLRRDEQTDALVTLQARMLKHAARAVAPGGTLVYSTCSLDCDEGERQVERFLAKNEAFSVSPVTPGEAGLERHFITHEGFFRSLPHHSIGPSRGLDGFFAARLTRAGS